MEEKRTNNDGFGLAPGAIRVEFVTFPRICASVSYCKRVFEQNSLVVTSNADSSAHVG